MAKRLPLSGIERRHDALRSACAGSVDYESSDLDPQLGWEVEQAKGLTFDVSKEHISRRAIMRTLTSSFGFLLAVPTFKELRFLFRMVWFSGCWSQVLLSIKSVIFDFCVRLLACVEVVGGDMLDVVLWEGRKAVRISAPHVLSARSPCRVL